MSEKPRKPVTSAGTLSNTPEPGPFFNAATLKPGEEHFERVVSEGKERLVYTYRHTDRAIYTTAAFTKEEAWESRDRWLERRKEKATPDS